MSGSVQRCRPCGGMTAYETDLLPPYGARLRCAECGSLLPLVLPPAAEAQARDEPAADPAPRPAAPGARDALGAARSEARQVLELWVQEVLRARPGRTGAEDLRARRQEELARLRSLWEASFPGAESARIFEEELQSALRRVEVG